MSIESWDNAIAPLKDELERMHRVREEALRSSRKLIQISSKCIRHIHRHQIEEAESLLEEARAVAAAARESLAPHPQILYAGYVQDAEKEMVEAAAMLSLALGKPMPSAEQLQVDATAYLNGLGEAASECRRFLLDTLREGNREEAGKLLKQMESIYDELITFDYPDGLTGGLRRTCDALRAVIERTRSDLTLTEIQQDLIEELRGSRNQ